MSLPWDTKIGWEFFIYNLIMLMLLSGFGFYGADAEGAVLLSEICADPASDWNGDGLVDSRSDEWVEVVNTGPGDVNLEMFYLRDALGEEPHLHLSGMLAEGGAAIFFGSDAEQWQAEQGLPISGLSLNNAGDQIELHLGHPQDPGAQMVDVRIYEDHVADDDRTTALILPQQEWILCDGLNPYGGVQEPVGTGCPPTPNETNYCEGLVAQEMRSWGELKHRWR